MSRDNSSEARTFYTEFFHLRPRSSEQTAQRMVPCPFHGDKKASLSINLNTGAWNCFAGCGNGGLVQFKQRMNGNGRKLPTTPLPTTKKLTKSGNSRARQTFTFRSLAQQGTKARKPVAEYVYVNAAGQPVMRKLRFEPKRFELEHMQNGQWVSGLTADTERPLYNLQRVLKADALVWCEGEKDVDNVQKALDLLGADGWAATTTYEAASGWHDRYSSYVADKHTVIGVADNDDAGRKYMVAMMQGCYTAGVEKVGTVELPGLAEHGDVSDYLGDHKPEELGATLSNEDNVIWHQDPVEQLIVTAAAMRLEATEEVPWLVEGMLAQGAVTQLMGQPKTGKSTLLHHMLKAMFAEASYLGKTVARVQDVVYLTEMPRTDLLPDLRQVPGLDEFEDHIHIIRLHQALTLTGQPL